MYNIVYTIFFMITLKNPVEFEWNEGNKDKNRKKHGVDILEIEEIFLSENKRIAKDFLHSEKEDRYIIIGKTRKNRLLFVVFTLRREKVRAISARDLNKKKEHKLAK